MKPNLLFLTPVLPFHTGSGTAIRAGVTVEALARHFNLYVFLVDFYGWHPAIFKTDFVEQRAAKFVHYQADSNELPMPAIVAEHFGGVCFHAIHACRLVMARAAIAAAAGAHSGPSQLYKVLDLDDDEQNRFQRLMSLREERGEDARVHAEQAAWPRLRTMERMIVTRFQALAMAAEQECATLRARYPTIPVFHLPNALLVSSGSPPPPVAAGRPPTLLFVGSMNYLPNEDAIVHFCKDILPLIRQRFGRPLRVRLVGTCPPERVRELARDPGVEVTGSVPEVDSYYADSDVSIVPLRAGSGTRIKILESFHLGRPVVSTRIGAEGLNVTDGRQLLLADAPEDFAAACVRLLENPGEGEKMALVARAWLLENHSIQTVDAAIQRIYEPVLG